MTYAIGQPMRLTKSVSVQAKQRRLPSSEQGKSPGRIDPSSITRLHGTGSKYPLASSRMRLSEVIGALSYTLDLTEGQPAGHSLRCTWIGMNVGQALALTPD